VHLELVAERRDQRAEGVLVAGSSQREQICVHVITLRLSSTLSHAADSGG
jgi:hypothetical protein